MVNFSNGVVNIQEEGLIYRRPSTIGHRCLLTLAYRFDRVLISMMISYDITSLKTVNKICEIVFFSYPLMHVISLKIHVIHWRK